MPSLDDTGNFLWLAGLFEGEGSFLKPSPSRPSEVRIEIEMLDRDVLARVAALLGAKLQVRYRRTFKIPRTVYRVRLTGKRAIAFMLRLQPYLSARRQVQINAALGVVLPTSTNRDLIPRYELQPVCRYPMCPHLAAQCETHGPEVRCSDKNA